MEATLEKIKQLINYKLPVSADFDDGLVKISILETKQYIINYCRIPKIPEQLNFTWANMAIDLLLYQSAKNKEYTIGGTAEDSEALANVVNRITVGDTTVQFGGDGNTAEGKAVASHKPDLDKLFFNYISILKKFRLLW